MKANLAVAVVGATIIRGVLLPATMKLPGSTPSAHRRR
jgi:hypothetical protein